MSVSQTALLGNTTNLEESVIPRILCPELSESYITEYKSCVDRLCGVVVRVHQIQISRVRFPTLPHFLRSSGSGTESSQPREDKQGAT
jgi:hypothetical protein